MDFLVIYDKGKNSSEVFQIYCSAEDAEQASKEIKEKFPNYRILGILLLNSKHTEDIVNNFTMACKIEDNFRNTIRDNIVSYEQ